MFFRCKSGVENTRVFATYIGTITWNIQICKGFQSKIDYEFLNFLIKVLNLRSWCVLVLIQVALLCSARQTHVTKQLT